jgi:hypothetical protein
MIVDFAPGFNVDGLPTISNGPRVHRKSTELDPGLQL